MSRDVVGYLSEEDLAKWRRSDARRDVALMSQAGLLTFDEAVEVVIEHYETFADLRERYKEACGIEEDDEVDFSVYDGTVYVED
ncbi:MAG: hypothetical protein M3P49_14295 [Actinomycetota bacterium]|nr:hypothetical protein [Actinomycetota bacterium]